MTARLLEAIVSRLTECEERGLLPTRIVVSPDDSRQLAGAFGAAEGRAHVGCGVAVPWMGADVTVYADRYVTTPIVVGLMMVRREVEVFT